MTYDENEKKAEDQLRPLLTDDFLKTLLLAAKINGHSGDFVETERLVRWCYGMAGKNQPAYLKPFDYSKDDFDCS